MQTADVPHEAPPLVLDGQPIHLDDVYGVAVEHRLVEVGPRAQARMTAARDQLDRLVSDERLVYGVTTGYGPLAATHVGPAKSADLQRNLVYMLASSVGPPLSAAHTRALMAARAVALSQGHSALRPQALDVLLACLRHDVLPIVPRRGTVGASGDLAPLAHMTLALMGEGEVMWRGKRRPAAEVFAAVGIEPLALAEKEGLAFVNGTSVMAGIAAVTGVRAERALRLALAMTVLYAELLRGRAEAFHPGIARLRPHPGQIAVTERLAAMAAASQRLVPHHPPIRLDEPDRVLAGQEMLQDPYSIRCAPQLYGAVHDVLAFHRTTVETELTSVTDNPLFVPEDDLVLHGGNFYGQHVAFVSDALASGAVTMAVHAERVLARITDPALNGDLPAFMQPREPGLRSGFMGAQITATAILAEMRTQSVPAAIQSIPTNANNQDVVTMGTIAARRAAEQVDHLYDLLAIEALVLTQGLELAGGDGFAPSSVALAGWVRERSQAVEEDRPLHADIAHVAADLRDGPLPDGL